MTRTVRKAATITNAPAASAAGYSTGVTRASAAANTADPLPRGSLMFPIDLIQSETQINSRQHHIRFVFSTYRNARTSGTNGLQLTGDCIDLPIPNNLADTQSVVYTEEAMGTIMGLGVEGTKEVASAAAGLGMIAGASILDQGVSGVQNFLNSRMVRYATQSMGFALNPFLQVMLQNPAFKQFEFTWKLSPRNARETEILRNIIRMFRYNMLPGTYSGSMNISGTGSSLNPLLNILGSAALSYPNVVHAQLFPDDKYLFNFKPMVIETMSVNFTPSGTPSFFRDVNGAPVEVVLTIRLKEIEIWLKEHVR